MAVIEQEKSIKGRLSRLYTNLAQGAHMTAMAATVAGSLALPHAAFAQAADALEPENAIITTAGEAADDSALFERTWLEEQGSPIGFGNPWLLLGVPLGIVALHYLLRSQPIRPKEKTFGPMFILERLQTTKATPDEMPFWERLPWYASMAAVFIAAADPELHKHPITFEQDGPVLIAVDNDWASAPFWTERRQLIAQIIREASFDDRGIAFISTAANERNLPIEMTDIMQPSVALSYLETMEAMPWTVGLREADASIEDLTGGRFGATFWVNNGLQDEFEIDFATTLEGLGPLTIFEGDLPHLIMPVEYSNGDYAVTVRRGTLGEEELTLSAYDEGNNLIGSVLMPYTVDARDTTVTFTPVDFGAAPESVFRFSINGEHGVGAAALVDNDMAPRTVGIAIRSTQDGTQSLLNESRFINAALEPYTDVIMGNIDTLLESGDISVLVLPDAVPLGERSRQALQAWVQDGGMVVRFAGDNLALETRTDDPLLPVDIRAGSRVLTGSNVTEEVDLEVAEFPQGSPFEAIVPAEEVNFGRQLTLSDWERTDTEIWARYSDGSPLVTSVEYGEGRVVLFHTTANMEWSDFSLTQNFVDMLVETVRQANSVENTEDLDVGEMPAISVMNSAGQLREPEHVVGNLTQDVLDSDYVGPEIPPGIYGTELRQVTYNLSDVVSDVVPLMAMPEGIEDARQSIAATVADKKDLKDWFWASAIGLAVAGGLILGHRRGGQHQNENNTGQGSAGRRRRQGPQQG